MGVWPLEAIDWVSAVAMSERSALTAAELMTVLGTKGGWASENSPLPFLGILVSYWVAALTLAAARPIVAAMRWLVVFLVIWANAEWHLTPNTYLAGLIGLGLAWLLAPLAGAFSQRPRDS